MWQRDQLDLARLQQLQREAMVLADRLSAAAAAVQGEFTGRDGDGAVEIAVGGDGVPTRVVVDPRWRQMVGNGGLGRAVVAALEDSAATRLAAWGNSAADDPVGQPPAPGWSDPAGGSELGDPSSRQSMHALRELFDLVGEVTAGLHVLSPAIADAATRSMTSTNTTRTVRVTAVGGTVSSVDFDDQWLRTVAAERLGSAILEALTTSVRDTAAARQTAVDAVPGLERVRRLSASPETLLREIGLIR